MKGIGTALSAVVLVGSIAAIGAGFIGGSSLSAASLVPRKERSAPAPAPIEPRERAERALVGIHSLDGADALDTDPLDDPLHGVAHRPAGWAPANFDPHHDTAKVAIVVVDAGRAGDALTPFLALPFPVALVVDARDEGAQATLQRLSTGSRTVLVGARSAADAALVRQPGVAGVWGTTRSMQAARALVEGAGNGIVVDDGTADDLLYRAARTAGRRAITRDVAVDARESDQAVAFMFRAALDEARATGAAVVAVHARTATYRALERFAASASRSGAEITSLDALAPPATVQTAAGGSP